ncbi:LacI family transcriptional regulator [Peribacillus cavernae]|uniref:LacI family transcriptional regulator n=1 Tax=Peribacillus cavernae TaxID=1674310 RepID=A0A433HVW3_9BACI|nr:LacI family DNA-binding transcriptional regulator [Peribacillus cavernae]MDQ0220696.1 LacI family transcriptional regulator [Peribacillus cavernae]RUQ32415.1 LacI family transcriptional regulator [Peribacillus cavernae]
MEKKLTINDIAEMAGVSRQTISRVLNNKPEVNAVTRNHVLRIIEKHGFQPSLQARSMVTRQTNMVAVLLPDIANPFFGEIVRGIERTLRANKLNVFLMTSEEDVGLENSFIQLSQNYNVDGMILCSPRLDEANLRRMIPKISPVVLLNRDVDTDGAACVVVDANYGGYAATKYLIEQGHTKIGIIAGPPRAYSSMQRLEGYKKALQEFNIPLETDLIMQVEADNKGVHQIAEQLIKKQVTAITTYNDLAAAHVIQACTDLKLSVPDDISVIGFDGIEISQFMNPSLTTMSLPLFEMGQTIANILIKMIKGNEAFDKITTVYPILKEGRSTTSFKALGKNLRGK